MNRKDAVELLNNYDDGLMIPMTTVRKVQQCYEDLLAQCRPCVQGRRALAELLNDPNTVKSIDRLLEEIAPLKINLS